MALKAARHLAYEHFLRLGDAVQVCVVAVPFVCKRLHPRVVEVAGSNAEHREKDPFLALFLNERLQVGRRAHADVEVSVGRENDAVVAVAE